MTILLLETIHPEAQKRLEEFGRVVVAFDAEDALRIAGDELVHAIITRGHGQVRQSLLEKCPDLHVVARVGVGLDNIDVKAAIRRRVKVINAPGSTTIATAEHTLLLIAALQRGLLPMAQGAAAGHWAVRNQYTGDDLCGKTLGIIGMGAIGQRVATLAEAFGMSVIYWNRSPKDLPYERQTLAALLAEADIVSVSVALAPETKHLLSHIQLAVMKPGALLVNTARGAIIDQPALVDALASGHLGGFATDVLEQEPPDQHEPLLQFPNVIVTPHIAALTETTYRKMSLRTADNVIAILSDESIEASDIVKA
jgi:phosphoglycerate dehydrogenase-like enzyme